MTATAEEVPGADLNDSNRMAETVAYEPKPPSESGPDGPMGSSDMSKANLTSQAHGRYIFGSGARRGIASKRWPGSDRRHTP